MSTNNPVPQRLIIISIEGVQSNVRVFYSYVSPIYGTTFIHSPTCDILINQPTNTLYLLDFATTANGWTITSITPRAPSEPLETMEGPLGLSIMTINRYDPPAATYNFYINYRNSITNQEISIDPQQGNIPPGQSNLA